MEVDWRGQLGNRELSKDPEDVKGWSSAVVVGLETTKREKQPDVCKK